MMKRLFILSVIVASAGSLLASCGKEPVVVKGPVPSDNPIEFRVPQTKGAAELSTLERLAAQDFSVSAWYTPDNETFGTGSTKYIVNHRFGTLDRINYSYWQGITHVGGDAADPVYYPLDGTLTYFCYAPYREDISESSDVNVISNPASAITDQLTNYLAGSPLICFTPSSPSTQIDFIASTPLLDVSRTSGAIALDFTNHLTTNVQFWVKYSGTMLSTEGVVVSQIIIRDVIGSEYLYFTDSGGSLGCNWCTTISPEDPSSSTMPKVSYTLKTDTSELQNIYLDTVDPVHVNQSINGFLYLLPQTLPEDSYLDIQYSIRNMVTNVDIDVNTISIPLYGTVDWPMGKIVKYTLTIDVANRKDLSLSANIVDWTDSGNSHTETELMY